MNMHRFTVMDSWNVVICPTWNWYEFTVPFALLPVTDDSHILFVCVRTYVPLTIPVTVSFLCYCLTKSSSLSFSLQASLSSSFKFSLSLSLLRLSTHTWLVSLGQCRMLPPRSLFMTVDQMISVMLCHKPRPLPEKTNRQVWLLEALHWRRKGHQYQSELLLLLQSGSFQSIHDVHVCVNSMSVFFWWNLPLRS